MAEEQSVDTYAVRPESKRLLFWGFGLSGVASLIYEVDWTRELSLVIGSTTYALSTVLAAFMTGLAMGALIGGKLAGKKDPLLLFGYLQFALGLSGMLVHLIINNLAPFYAWTYYTFNDFPSFYFSMQFLLVFFILLVPTSMMGAIFPIVVKAYAKNISTIAEDTGKIYSINTLGSVIGAVASGFILIPYLGLAKTCFFASLLNITMAIYILGRNFRRLAVILGIYVMLAAIFFSVPTNQFFFNLYYANRIPSYDMYKNSLDYFKVIWEKEDVEGTVQVTQGGNPPIYGINIRGKPEGTSNYKDDPSQMLMTYLPLASRPHAKSFLKIGLGPGVTLFAASRVDTLSSIDAVEINGSVVKAVREFFFPSLFTDKRIRFIVADARKYLIHSEKKYDIITSQPSDPTDQSSGYLFTREYYEIVKSRLTRDGIYSQFIPFYLLDKGGTDILIKTFATVFPYVYGWNIKDRGSLLLIGSLSPEMDQPSIIMARVEGYEKGLSSEAYFGAGPDKIRKITFKDIPINTDDKDIIEFIAARKIICKSRC